MAFRPWRYDCTAEPMNQVDIPSNHVQEQSVRKTTCKFIAEVGQQLIHPASIIAINSAKVFLNRYYMVEPMDVSTEKLHQQKVVPICCTQSAVLRLIVWFPHSWSELPVSSSHVKPRSV